MNQEIYANTFAIYKNLMFYDQFNERYVYFASLKNYEGDTDEYLQARNEVIAGIDKGRTAFFAKNKSKMFDFGSNNIGIGNFLRCIKFIKEAIKYETQNEIAFFNQKLKELQAQFSDKELQEIPAIKQLIDMFNVSKQQKGFSLEGTSGGIEEIIDYDKFLAVINSLLQGIEKTKTIVKYESQRLTKIDQALEFMKKKKGKQLVGMAKAYGKDQDWIDENMEKYSDTIDAYYLKNKNFESKRDKENKVYESLRGATTAMRNIPKSVAVELAHWINKQLQNIFSNQAILDKITKYVQDNAILAPNYQNQVAFMVKGIIAQALVAEANNNLERILDKHYRKIPKKKIVQELEKNISISQSYRIEGFYQNWATSGRHLKGFDSLDENFDLHEASAEGMTQAMRRFIKAIRKAEKGKYQIREEQAILKEYLKENDLDKDFSDIITIINQLSQFNSKLEIAERKIRAGKVKQTETFSKRIGSSKKESVVLTMQITPNGVILDDFDQKIKSLKTFQNLFGEDSNMKLSTIKNAISTITSNTSKVLRDKLATSIDKAVDQVAFEEKNALRLKLNTMIRDGLEQLKVGVRGPDVAEILTNIDFRVNDKGALVDAATGRKLILNDSILITVDTRQFHFETEIEELSENSTKQLSDLIIESTSDNTIEEQLQYNIIQAFHDTTTKGFSKFATAQKDRYSNKARVFLERYDALQKREKNLEKEYKEVLASWDTYADHLRSTGADEKTIAEKYKKIVEVLKDSFYISTTVKTYNQYYNKMGFGGGSLGSTLDNQLANISDMFKLAGMPISPTDLDWLRFLIINCGSQMYMGEEQRPRLEQYLGSLAAFMLFDEGGAEARILQKLPEDVNIRRTSPKILHLYNLNGVYITGSYVLKQVLETLEASVTIMQQANFKGAGIRIINNMSESLIPNRKGSIESTTPWADVANQAGTNVSLEIFFLAGLLQTVNNINKQMANIELPK